MYIPGGRAPEYLRLDDKGNKLVIHFKDNMKSIGAINHGIQILAAIPSLLKDKKVNFFFFF